MPISAIDTYTVAPRSAEASGLVGREQSQVQHMNETGVTNFQKNVQQQSQKTVETKKSETEEYNFEGSGKNGYNGSKNKKKQKKSEQQRVAPKSNSSFDIMI